jgi:hypothetical protein
MGAPTEAGAEVVSGVWKGISDEVARLCPVGKSKPPACRLGRLHARAGIRIRLSKLNQMIVRRRGVNTNFGDTPSGIMNSSINLKNPMTPASPIDLLDPPIP